jgi:glycosyltransferase involved in cell wall biosynthesis
MNNAINTEVTTINPSYGTTRTVTRQQPVIEKQAEDKFETVLFLPEGEARQGEGGLRTQGYFKANLEGKPLITVVTAVLNGEKFLEETIQSVINQTYDNVEYIIIDGGSTDDTLDIIRKYEYAIDYWVSEKDKGTYDAMNKGIQLAIGKAISLINSDDFYYDNSVLKVLLDKWDLCFFDICFSNMIFIDAYTRAVLEERSANINKIYFGMYLNHPSVFVQRSHYKKIGMFDFPRFKLAADYDFILRSKVSGASFYYLKENMTYMRDGGISIQNYNETLSETKKAREKNISYLMLKLTNFIKWIKGAFK